MSKSSQTSSSWSNTDGRAHYKITKTVTGSDGKTHTETVEMADDDAIKVSRVNSSEVTMLFCLTILANATCPLVR